MKFSTPSKLTEICSQLKNKMIRKKFLAKFFFCYLVNYFLLKETQIHFSKESVAKIENIIIENLPSFFLSNQTDFEIVFYILMTINQIYFYQMKFGEIDLSKILNFLRAIDFLKIENFWKNFYIFLNEQLLRDDSLFFYTSPACFNHGRDAGETSKKQFKNSKDILVYLMGICFYVLMLPHDVILSNFIHINKEITNLPNSDLMHLSSFMEKQIFNIYSTLANPSNLYTATLSSKKKCNIKKTFILISNFIPYTDYTTNINLILTKRSITPTLLKKFYKKILKSKSNLKKETRLRLYNKLIGLESLKYVSSKSKWKNLSRKKDKDNYFLVIDKDIQRTKFFKGDKSDLEFVLCNVVELLPTIGYYQGLNCLAAVMLDYTGGDCLASFQVIVFLLEKKLKRYIFDDFKMLNKLIFLGEKVIEYFHQDIYMKLQQCEIGFDYFLTSIIITLYSNTNQFSQNTKLILYSLDLFFSQEWVGFFKVTHITIPDINIPLRAEQIQNFII